MMKMYEKSASVLKRGKGEKGRGGKGLSGVEYHMQISHDVGIFRSSFTSYTHSLADCYVVGE